MLRRAAGRTGQPVRSCHAAQANEKSEIFPTLLSTFARLPVRRTPGLLRDTQEVLPPGTSKYDLLCRTLKAPVSRCPRRAGACDAPGSAASVAGRYLFPASRAAAEDARGPRVPVPAARRVTPSPPTSARRAPPRLARPGSRLGRQARRPGPRRGKGGPGPPLTAGSAEKETQRRPRHRVRLWFQQDPRSCPAPNTVANAAASGFMAKAPALLPLPPPPPPRAEVPVTRHSTPGVWGGGAPPPLCVTFRSRQALAGRLVG